VRPATARRGCRDIPDRSSRARASSRELAHRVVVRGLPML
jgi:hypothetical protein